MKAIFLLLALLPLMNGFSQTNLEIESFTRNTARFLGAPEKTVNESNLVQQELTYVGDDVWGIYYVKHYVKKNSTVLVDLGFENLPWYNFSKCLSKITMTYISNNSYSSFFDYINTRSVFQQVTSGKYVYLAFDSPLLEIMKSMDYSTVIYEITQKKDLVASAKSGYSLYFTISLTKDK
jgi:hypothetical protein